MTFTGAARVRASLAPRRPSVRKHLPHRDLKRVRDADHSVKPRRRLPEFSAVDQLPVDPGTLRQGFLGQPCLFPQCSEPIAELGSPLGNPWRQRVYRHAPTLVLRLLQSCTKDGSIGRVTRKDRSGESSRRNSSPSPATLVHRPGRFRASAIPRDCGHRRMSSQL